MSLDVLSLEDRLTEGRGHVETEAEAGAGSHPLLGGAGSSLP